MGLIGRLRWRRFVVLFAVASVIVWTGNRSFAAPQAVQVSFLGGDVSADPQSPSGTNSDRRISVKGAHKATIDFTSFESGNCTNNVGVLSYLQDKNPINGTLEIFVDKTNRSSSGNKLAWNTQLEGKSYRILLFQFPELLISESEADTNVQGGSGNVEIIVSHKGKNVLAQGTKCTNVVDVNFSVAK